jgi:hypothetical protein
MGGVCMVVMCEKIKKEIIGVCDDVCLYRISAIGMVWRFSHSPWVF